jgi:endogenous inhibitor of DNA gyrase (YacG/DUF329 family)
MVVVCEVCGTSINRKPSEIGKRIFCSKKCFYKKLSSDKTLNGRYAGGKAAPCFMCGKEVYRTPSQLLLANNRYFCSQRCAGEWRSENLIGEKASNFKNKLKTNVCPICKKPFTTYSKMVVCCSIKCSAIAKHNKSTAKCISCKKIFERPKSYFKWHKERGNKRFFCSRKCFGNYKIGENNHNWISDRSKLKDPMKSLRWSNSMKMWRKAVFKRDNYTCQMCGDRSRKGHPVTINAHHIIAIKQRKRTATEISNGITLCEACHKKTYAKEHEFAEMFFEIIAGHTSALGLKRPRHVQLRMF